jgi:hypothetical protein
MLNYGSSGHVTGVPVLSMLFVKSLHFRIHQLMLTKVWAGSGATQPPP